jgi:hypothetical protein
LGGAIRYWHSSDWWPNGVSDGESRSVEIHYAVVYVGLIALVGVLLCVPPVFSQMFRLLVPVIDRIFGAKSRTQRGFDVRM